MVSIVNDFIVGNVHWIRGFLTFHLQKTFFTCNCLSTLQRRKIHFIVHLLFTGWLMFRYLEESCKTDQPTLRVKSSVILQLKFYVSKLKTVKSCFTIKVYRRRMRIVRMTSDSSCLYLTLILLLSNIICNRYNRHHASHKFLKDIQLSNGFGSLFLEFFWSLKW